MIKNFDSNNFLKILVIVLIFATLLFNIPILFNEQLNFRVRIIHFVINLTIWLFWCLLILFFIRKK